MHQSTSASPSLLLLFSLSLLFCPSIAQSEGWAATTVAPVASSSADWAQIVTWPAGCETWANPCPSGAHTSGVAPSPAVVTWPAGCESWANPCPVSAIVSSAAEWQTSSYDNPFTSYTTMTNSNGIITGMPSKATVAPGASSVLSEQSAALATQTMQTTQTTLNTVVTGSASSPLSSLTFPSASFVESASSTASASAQPFQGAAVANGVTGAGAALICAGIIGSFLA